MLPNKNSSHQKLVTLSTDLFLELKTSRAFEHTSKQMFFELLTSHGAKDNFSTAGGVASIKGEEFKLNRFKGVNDVASSHPHKFLFAATPRGDNEVKTARVNMLSLFLAGNFGLASFFQTKEKQKSLTKENGIGEPASPSLPDISSGTSIKTNTKKQPDSPPEVRENTQNVNGVGISSQNSENLTPSITSQKQIYTQEPLRGTSCLDRTLIISKFIILMRLYIYISNIIQLLLPETL